MTSYCPEQATTTNTHHFHYMSILQQHRHHIQDCVQPHNLHAT